MLLEIFNLLHLIGLAFGLGGATIAAIISTKAEKDKELAGAQMKLMPSISKLIMLGLLLLIISGIALPFYIKWPLDKQLLIIKHVLVVWIIIIGIFIGRRFKKMSRISPVGKEKPKAEFLRAKKQVKILSIINLILWYAVTIMSAFV
jgi:uncharacterized membrane protein